MPLLHRETRPGCTLAHAAPNTIVAVQTILPYHGYLKPNRLRQVKTQRNSSQRPAQAELDAYERLKPRLAALWKDVFVHEDAPYTSVIVPSVALEPRGRARRRDALCEEETLLFLLTRLRNPRARVVYVTSQPIAPVVLEYYLQFLSGIPASHARGRLALLTAYDASPRPLTEKILERPRLLERIRAAIPDASRAFLRVIRATPLERRLAVLLGIPLDAADPGLESLCSGSSAEEIFRAAGLDSEPPSGVVRERGAGPQVSASAQLRIDPSGEAVLVSTHDELRGGTPLSSNRGCRFPADERHRRLVQEAGLSVGRLLAARGVTSRLSVEFLVVRSTAGDQPRLLGSEISLGMGRSTYPLLGVRFLCGGGVEPATGLFRSLSGRLKYYRASDHVASRAYRRLLPEDLIDLLTLRRLNFSAQTECGALVYMLGALSEFGRVGLLAVGNSRDEAEAVYLQAIETLEQASAGQMEAPAEGR